MFLSRILGAKKEEIARKTMGMPLVDLKRRAEAAPAPGDFLGAVQKPGLGVIAEIKRASPSKGDLCPNIDAPALAREYEAGGCVAISVLTDVRFFRARPEDLPSVRAAVSVPVLRKDFLLSDYQIWESRAMGADALLLIVAALEKQALADLVKLTSDLGMCPLVEIHSEREMATALDAGAPLIGINNRNLVDFSVDLDATRRLRPLVPTGIPVIAESGIRGADDAALVHAWGVNAILVGEALVSSSDPRELIKELTRG